MFNFIKKQFIDIIQWENPDEETLVWRFPIADQEIQNGASLTVREAQMAMFVDEGRTADVFPAGRYTLNTQTLPILTYLKNWDKLFQSPFKSDVYFFNTKQQLGRKWGTAQPVTVRDAEFGAVQLRSFGMYSYRITDPEKFFKEVSGVVESYTGAQLEHQLRNLAVTQLATAFGTSGIPFLDMAANQVLLSQQLTGLLAPEFAKLGLTLENFTVESISLPENIQKALDKKISMGIVGDMGRFAQYQTAESITMAAQNEGGLAGIGAGLGVGAGIGQTVAGAMAGMMQPAAATATAAPAAAEEPSGQTAKTERPARRRPDFRRRLRKSQSRSIKTTHQLNGGKRPSEKPFPCFQTASHHNKQTAIRKQGRPSPSLRRMRKSSINGSPFANRPSAVQYHQNPFFRRPHIPKGRLKKPTDKTRKPPCRNIRPPCRPKS